MGSNDETVMTWNKYLKMLKNMSGKKIEDGEKKGHQGQRLRVRGSQVFELDNHKDG